MAGKVAIKKLLVDRNVFKPRDGFTRDERGYTIDQQEWVTMWEILKNLRYRLDYIVFVYFYCPLIHRPGQF